MKTRVYEIRSFESMDYDIEYDIPLKTEIVAKSFSDAKLIFKSLPEIGKRYIWAIDVVDGELK